MMNTSSFGGSWKSGSLRILIACVAFVTLSATASFAQSQSPSPSDVTIVLEGVGRADATRTTTSSSELLGPATRIANAEGSSPVSNADFLQPIMALPTDSLLWDKPADEMQAAGVDHFDVCFDAQPCTNVPITAKIGNSFGIKLPALTLGTHSVTVAACNAVICSDPSTPLNFTFAIKPTGVSNLRTGSGGGN